MACILSQHHRDGGEKGALIANDEGIALSTTVTKERHGLKVRKTFAPTRYLVRWADVAGYELGAPESKKIIGGTSLASHVVLTVRTADRLHSFQTDWTDAGHATNMLGAYLARLPR